LDRRTVDSLYVRLLHSRMSIKGCINWVLFCAIMIMRQICRSKAPRFPVQNSCILNIEDMTTLHNLAVISCKFGITVMCTSKRLPRSRSKICNSYFLLDPACRLKKFRKSKGANFLRNYEALERERTKQRKKREKVTRVAASIHKFNEVFVWLITGLCFACRSKQWRVAVKLSLAVE